MDFTRVSKNHGIKRIITSKIEHHHATLYVCLKLAKEYAIELDFVPVLPSGNLDLSYLEKTIEKKECKTLVSLMHVNNEIGTVLNLEEVSLLCKKKKSSSFHCDTVQTMGKTKLTYNKSTLILLWQVRINFMDLKELVLLIFQKHFFTTYASWWRTRKRITSRNRSHASNCRYGKKRLNWHISN